MTKSPPKILIDADILLYQTLLTTEHEIEFEDDLWVMFTDLKEATTSFKDKVTKITDQVGTDNILLCFSDKENFRKDINPTYKMNRKATRKPMGFLEFKELAMEAYPSISKPRLEADDILGILQTKPGANTIIVTMDKDLKQIPGKHLVNGEVITITKEQGDHFHMLQTLMGDAVDGYAGCPGIGKVKAEKILASGEPWPTIVETYEKAGLGEEDALLMARMARILQWDDWDGDKQKVKLWNPQ